MRGETSRGGCGRTLLTLLMAAAIFVCGVKVGAHNPDFLSDLAYAAGKKFSHLRDSRPVVVIDAGHGGEDPGAQGLIDESTLTADTARALFGILTEDNRFQVFYTHTPGEGAAIQERYAASNAHYPDLLISIHANSDPAGEGRGFECYPIPPGRKDHEESLRMAALTIDAFTELGVPIRGENGIRYAYYDANDEKYITESSDTSVHSDPSFGLLEKSRCPTLLMEQCFVTNSSDVALLSGGEGTMRAANAYYKAICGFFEEELSSGS